MYSTASHTHTHTSRKTTSHIWCEIGSLNQKYPTHKITCTISDTRPKKEKKFKKQCNHMSISMKEILYVDRFNRDSITSIENIREWHVASSIAFLSLSLHQILCLHVNTFPKRKVCYIGIKQQIILKSIDFSGLSDFSCITKTKCTMHTQARTHSTMP